MNRTCNMKLKTVFLWNPLGNDEMKHSVERGLINHGSPKYCIRKTIAKQHRPSAQSQP